LEFRKFRGARGLRFLTVFSGTKNIPQGIKAISRRIVKSEILRCLLINQCFFLGGAAVAVLARRIVNAGSWIEFVDAIVAYPDHFSSV